jgi:hypothetical protein
VDRQGETVDYAGFIRPYDLRVAAAEWRLILDACDRSQTSMLRGIDEVIVRTRRASYAAYQLSEGYALVICLPGGAFRTSPRALGQAIRDLCREGGLATPRNLPPECWLRVQIREEDRRHRPRWIRYDGTWQALHVLGRYHGAELLPREVAYRVRLENGLETMLVRERLGRWFSDHPVHPIHPE